MQQIERMEREQQLLQQQQQQNQNNPLNNLLNSALRMQQPQTTIVYETQRPIQQPMYVQPQPMYVQQQPMYVQQQPMYVQQQQPLYYQQQQQTYPIQQQTSFTTLQTQPTTQTTTTVFEDDSGYYGKDSSTQVKKEVVVEQTTSYPSVNPFYGQQVQQQQIQQQQIQQQQVKQVQQYDQKVEEVTVTMQQVKIENTDSLVWPQPLSTTRPSLVSTMSKYTDEDALADAKKLRHALKYIGGDHDTVCSISGERSHDQRMMIRKAYVKVDDKGERELLKDIHSDLSGDFKKTVEPLYSDAGFADARWMKDAITGLHHHSDIMLELLCTRSNQQLKSMKDAWGTFEKEPLVKKVSEIASKLFSAGHFKVFCANILELKRPDNGPVDDKAAMADAERLNRALLQEKKGDAKEVFINIFTERSWRHIAAVSAKFQQISKKWTLEAAIKHEWGDTDTSKGMRIILEFSTAPYDYWAQKLNHAMAGLGTDDFTLQRVVISRCEIDLYNIAEVFAERYGKGKTLRSWIESDTSGSYKKLLLKLSGY